MIFLVIDEIYHVCGAIDYCVNYEGIFHIWVLIGVCKEFINKSF